MLVIPCDWKKSIHGGRRSEKWRRKRAKIPEGFLFRPGISAYRLVDKYLQCRVSAGRRFEPGTRTPMYPYVAPHTAKIHTLITLGIRHCAKALVFQLRKHRPDGFDSHRPLHFSLPGVSLRCPRTRLSSSSSSHSLDAATVHLIERVDRLLGRARSRRPHP